MRKQLLLIIASGMFLSGFAANENANSGAAGTATSATRARPVPMFGYLQSFCGFEFGGLIDDKCSAVTEKASDEAFHYSLKMPTLVSKFTLTRPFRNFKSGTVYAVPRSRQIYKVVFDTYYFPNQAKGSGAAEHKQVLAALKQKFGASRCKSSQNAYGDFTHEFVIGEMVITFNYTTAGVFDKESLDLRAENPKIWEAFFQRVKSKMEKACEKAAQEALQEYLSGKDPDPDSPKPNEPLIEGVDVL